MKKFFTLILAALAFAGCGLMDGDTAVSYDFIHSGCAKTTKAGMYDADSELRLTYTPEGLLVIRKNAEVNCAVKQDGLECKVSVEANTIGYRVCQKSDVSANCLCLVEEMSSTVTGLVEGSEYTIYYWCEDERPLVPISFTFDKNLNLIIDTDLYMAELVEIEDGVWTFDVPYWREPHM